jgi:alginate O-acetyltransferase complex protein AlgJ
LIKRPTLTFKWLSFNLTQKAKISFENVCLTATFCLILTFFSVCTFFKCVQNSELEIPQEKRFPNPFPRVHTVSKDLPLFAGAFALFLDDHFAGRSSLIRARNLLLLKVFNSSGHPDVAIGKNNWFFYYIEAARRAQINYKPLSKANLRLWAKLLTARRDLLAAHHIKYVFLMPPEKGTIYSEHLPEALGRRDGLSPLDALQSYLKSNTSVDFVDAKQALFKAKNSGAALYYLRDAHWNELGAFAATKVLLMKIGDYSPTCISTFECYPFQPDLASLLKLAPELSEKFPRIKAAVCRAHLLSKVETPFAYRFINPASAYSNENKKLPRVFMIHDSFGIPLMPLVAESASFAQFYSTREFDADMILGQHPDVFIDEMVERHLYDSYPDNVPDAVKIIRKTINPNATVGDDAGKPTLANFSDRIELVDLAASPSADGVLLKLLWRSKMAQKLSGRVTFSTMSDAQSTISWRDYAIDSFQRNVDADAEWIDTFELTKSDFFGAKQFGIAIVDKKLGYLLTQAKHCDVTSNRALIPVTDSLSNLKAFENTYVVESSNSKNFH